MNTCRRLNNCRKAGLGRKFKWLCSEAMRQLRSWKRSLSSETRELDAFKRAARLEQKLADYPSAIPVLNELERFYRNTRQDARRLEMMRRLRDIPPRPIPDFMWEEEPPVAVYRNNIEAWRAKIEKLIQSKNLSSIHFQHIQNHLRISRAHAQEVCFGLESDGIIGAFDYARSRYQVLRADV